MKQFLKINCSLYICMYPIDSVSLKNPNRLHVLVWAAKTNYHRLGWFKQQTLISHSSGFLDFSRSGCISMVKFLVSISWFTEGHCAVSSFSRKGLLAIWTLISLLILLFIRLRPHDLIASGRPYFQVPSHWELDFNVYILSEHEHQSLMLGMVPKGHNYSWTTQG